MLSNPYTPLTNKQAIFFKRFLEYPINVIGHPHDFNTLNPHSHSCSFNDKNVYWLQCVHDPKAVLKLKYFGKNVNSIPFKIQPEFGTEIKSLPSFERR